MVYQMYEHVDVFFDQNYLQNVVHKSHMEMVVLLKTKYLIEKSFVFFLVNKIIFTQYVFVYEF